MTGTGFVQLCKNKLKRLQSVINVSQQSLRKEIEMEEDHINFLQETVFSLKLSIGMLKVSTKRISVTSFNTPCSTYRGTYGRDTNTWVPHQINNFRSQDLSGRNTSKKKESDSESKIHSRSSARGPLPGVPRLYDDMKDRSTSNHNMQFSFTKMDNSIEDLQKSYPNPLGNMSITLSKISPRNQYMSTLRPDSVNDSFDKLKRSFGNTDDIKQRKFNKYTELKKKPSKIEEKPSFQESSRTKLAKFFGNVRPPKRVPNHRRVQSISGVAN